MRLKAAKGILWNPFTLTTTATEIASPVFGSVIKDNPGAKPSQIGCGVEHDRADMPATEISDLLLRWSESDGDCRHADLLWRQDPLCWRLRKKFV
jgi:hypothetical protein